MDTTGLIFSLFFGLVGAGMLAFGKQTGRVVPMGSGLALMLVPSMLPAAAGIILGLVLCAAPVLFRDA